MGLAMKNTFLSLSYSSSLGESSPAGFRTIPKEVDITNFILVEIENEIIIVTETICVEKIK